MFFCQIYVFRRNGKGNVARFTHENLHHLLFIASLYSPCAPNLNIFDGTLCESISQGKNIQTHFPSSIPAVRLIRCSLCIIMYKIFIEKVPFIAILCVRATLLNENILHTQV
jgi:hypothetical protein